MELEGNDVASTGQHDRAALIVVADGVVDMAAVVSRASCVASVLFEPHGV